MLTRRLAQPSVVRLVGGKSVVSAVSHARYYASSTFVTEIADQAHFEKAVMEASDSKPVIVDCYAEYALPLPISMNFVFKLTTPRVTKISWCRPCRQLAPKLEGAVDSRKGAVLLAKVNVDSNAEVAQQLMVTSIPAG